MTSMKDYVDEKMNDVPEDQQDIEDLANTFWDAIADGHCPYCNGTRIFIQQEEEEYGPRYIHSCVDCGGSWYFAFNRSEQFISFGPVIDEPEPE